MVKPEGSEVGLRFTCWDGPLPEAGDFLRTPSGRCYRVESIARTRPGSRSVARVRCLVLGQDAVSSGDPGVFDFAFDGRRRTAGR